MMHKVDRYLGSFIVELLAKPALQKRLTEYLIERGLKRDINEEECILLEEGKWIRMSNLIKYKYIQRAIEKVAGVVLLTQFLLGLLKNQSLYFMTSLL